MIEGVNSVVAATPFLRGVSGQGAVEAASVGGTTPSLVELKGIQVPFISPYVYVNMDYDKAVLQIRNAETGDVVNQIPSDNRLAAQQRAILADEAIMAQVAAARESVPLYESVALVQSEGSTSEIQSPIIEESTSLQESTPIVVPDSPNMGESGDIGSSVSVLA